MTISPKHLIEQRRAFLGQLFRSHVLVYVLSLVLFAEKAKQPRARNHKRDRGGRGRERIGRGVELGISPGGGRPGQTYKGSGDYVPHFTLPPCRSSVCNIRDLEVQPPRSTGKKTAIKAHPAFLRGCSHNGRSFFKKNILVSANLKLVAKCGPGNRIVMKHSAHFVRPKQKKD